MSKPLPEPSARLSGLVRHSAMYSAAPLLRQLISLAMTRFYTEWLAKPGFGLKDVLDLWIIGLQQVLGLSVLGAMVRFYFDGKSEADRARTVTSCTLFVLLAAWALCGALFFLSPELKPLMLGGADEVRGNDLVQVLQLLFVLVPFQLATQSGLYYLATIKRSGAHTTIQTAKLLFEVGLNFLLIGHLDMGVVGFLLSMLAGEALTSLLLLAWMFSRLGVRLDWKLLRPVLVYAMPLVPVALCQLALHNLDRRLLLRLASVEDPWAVAGVYGLAYKIGFLATTMLLAPFLQIWHPWIFGIQDERERARQVARIGTWAVLAIGVTSLCVILFGRQATWLLDGSGEFTETYRIIPYVAGAYVFWALYRVSEMPLLIEKRTGRLFAINLLAVALNVVLNIALIPRYGAQGAGMATAGTIAFLTLLGMIASRSAAGVRFEFGRLGTILGTVVVGAVVALAADGMEVSGRLSPALTLALKAAALVALLGFLWRVPLAREERSKLVAWLARRGRA